MSTPTVGGGVVYYVVDGSIAAANAQGCGAATCGELRRLAAGTGGRYMSLASGHLFVAHGGLGTGPALVGFAP